MEPIKEMSNVGVMELMLLFLIVALIVIGGSLLIFILWRKRKASPKTVVQMPASRSETDQQRMKRCSQCNSTYTDITLRYCLVDGSDLVDVVASHPPRIPAQQEPPPTARYDHDVLK